MAGGGRGSLVWRLGRLVALSMTPRNSGCAWLCQPYLVSLSCPLPGVQVVDMVTRGIFINMVGLAATLTGVQALVGMLVAKTLQVRGRRGRAPVHVLVRVGGMGQRARLVCERKGDGLSDVHHDGMVLLVRGMRVGGWKIRQRCGSRTSHSRVLGPRLGRAAASCTADEREGAHEACTCKPCWPPEAPLTSA